MGLVAEMKWQASFFAAYGHNCISLWTATDPSYINQVDCICIYNKKKTLGFDSLGNLVL